MQKTLGGDRLGSGKKMKVELHNYERSTHDLGYVWRSTMASGTLVPFMSEVALPGDTFDIKLNCDVKTHPTIGPLFGSYKVQLDVFLAPMRLYNSWLHNNMLGVGLNMSQIALPQIELPVTGLDVTDYTVLDNLQINPSCILNYLGIRGIGLSTSDGVDTTRSFNAIPYLAYWEIYKNYYANKQEEIGAVIHTPHVANIETVDLIKVGGVTLDQAPTTSNIPLTVPVTFRIEFTGTQPIPNQILVNTDLLGDVSLEYLVGGWHLVSTGVMEGTYYGTGGTGNVIQNWRYRTDTDVNQGIPAVVTFPLSNIDTMRQNILSTAGNTTYVIDYISDAPYGYIPSVYSGVPSTLSTQEGLGLKTYQSDLFNNWLKTENMQDISDTTAIDTSGGSFTIDTLILSRKVYNMLNRIAVSGGSYDDWIDAVYAHEGYRKVESPMYMGGLIKELVFSEIFSNSTTTDQPLGTLAGKGTMAGKHKGGTVVIKADEPSYVIGIISLTPRIDYSQGNRWDTGLSTLDELHKPALDEIGFQDLITEQMAWWDTQWDAGTSSWIQKSAGKQPAWINYMTNYNRTYGNFAITDNEMFMTLNRRYERTDGSTPEIKDLTTYIDPSKFNFIFAETNLDAQNFWVQIAADITARRKMSAKIMPNL